MSNSNKYFKPHLLHARQSIDIIDNKIIELLTERSACVATIGQIKRENDLSAFDTERENSIIERVIQHNPTQYQSTDLGKIFRAIFRAGLNQQLLHHVHLED